MLVSLHKLTDLYISMIVLNSATVVGKHETVFFQYPGSYIINNYVCELDHWPCVIDVNEAQGK